MLILFIVYSSI